VAIVSDHKRRQWKLAAIRAFSTIEPVSCFVIAKNIGDHVLDALLNESFIQHPTDPIAGANVLEANLKQRFGDHFKAQIVRTKRRPRGASQSEPALVFGAIRSTEGEPRDPAAKQSRQQTNAMGGKRVSSRVR
jgi:hypothetical protein